ncbi:MAG: hypothetical protein NY202_05260 [Mollicutes bacterium UO1]
MDNYVEFKGKNKQKFIYCLNENPFINYQEGDKIEVDLNIARVMSPDAIISGSQGIVSKIYSGNSYDYYSSEQHEGENSSKKSKIGGVLTQASVTLSAYETKSTYDFLYDTLE